MGHEMREGAFWAAIHPPGLSGCSKQLEGGFSPLMWKGRHYCDDDDAVPSLPQFPFPFLSPLLWSDLTDWHWEEGGRGWLGWGAFLPRLGDFLDDNEPIVDRSVIQPNWLCTFGVQPDRISYLFQISDAFILFLSSSHADLQFAS